MHAAAVDKNDEELSDLEEDEAQDLLYTKREADIKAQLWLAMNQEYVEKQEAKAAIQAACSKVALQCPHFR